jgi:hypothetical protein
MAWEALVEAHTRHALQFISLFADRMPFDESADRYLKEMGVPDTMAVGVRTRVLVALEDADNAEGEEIRVPLAPDVDEDDIPAGGDGWGRFRPDRFVRGVVMRSRKNEETDRWIQLAIARAEEGVMLAHIDNAITFTALLDAHMPLDRAVQEYIESMNLVGGRAQAVFQRTMARLADVHLPDADLDLFATIPAPEPEDQ